MEDILCTMEVKRTEHANESKGTIREMNFRRRPSEGVCKSPYAALNGNFLSGE
jgi:hypothetical protein